MKNSTIQISTTTIIKTILILAGAYLLWYLRDLLLILLASLVIASAIEPAAIALSKKKVPRVLSVLFVYLTFFATFLGVIVFLLPPILNETKDLLKTIPGYLENIGATSQGATTLNESFQDLSMQVNALLKGVQDGDFVTAISFVFGGLMSFIFIVVFSFYFAINERGIEEFLRVVSPRESEEYMIDLWRRTQNKIGLWMQGQLLLAILIGVLVYLGLSILGVPYALALGVLAGVFELIPVFGPILSAIPAVALAFSGGGLPLAIIVVGFYIIIQQFENHLIYPLVVTKVVGVPPVLVILALLVGAKLAGILGILLSVPVAAALQELFNDFGKSKTAKSKSM
jgi:predicted PurR-regulated permease PerM